VVHFALSSSSTLSFEVTSHSSASRFALNYGGSVKMRPLVCGRLDTAHPTVRFRPVPADRP
jgi:hypothetical protein